jgi:hypothetical protein
MSEPPEVTAARLALRIANVENHTARVGLLVAVLGLLTALVTVVGAITTAILLG